MTVNAGAIAFVIHCWITVNVDNELDPFTVVAQFSF
jgi:hypothetical protein